MNASALRAGVTERDAADVIHALMSPEVYRLLATDCRWSPDRYQIWLADTLPEQFGRVLHQVLTETT